MEQNENGNDRIARVIIGVVFIVLARYILQGGRSLSFYILGILGLITGITGFCLLYKILGINTHKPPKQEQS